MNEPKNYNEILERIDKKIDESVNKYSEKYTEKYINGHLREIKNHLGEQDIKIDGLIKSTSEVIETYNNSRGFFKVVKNAALFIIPVAAAWAIIRSYFIKV